MDDTDWRGLLVLVFVASASLSLAGCFTFSSTHTATPLEKHETEFGVSSGYMGLSGAIPTGGTALEDQLVLNVPTVELSLRHGIAEDLDMGFKVFPLGGAVDLNYAPINNSNFALSFNPSVSVTGVIVSTWGNATLNVLLDVLKTENFTLTVGGKQGYLFVASPNQVQDFIISGGTVMLEWRFNENIRFRPGIDVVYPMPGNQVSSILSEGTLGVVWKF